MLSFFLYNRRKRGRGEARFKDKREQVEARFRAKGGAFNITRKPKAYTKSVDLKPTL